MFTTIVADPAWQYRDKLRMSAVARSAMDQYKHTMTLDQIAAMATCEPDHPVHRSISKAKDLRIAGYRIADPAVLFLWITNPFLLSGAGASTCMAWGFEPKQLISWIKGEIRLIELEDTSIGAAIIGPPGMGHYTRGDTEHMILATRGKAKQLVKARNVRNWFVAPKSEHSEKPEASYLLVERLVPGPYLELFARRRRAGWTHHGDELPVEN